MQHVKLSLTVVALLVIAVWATHRSSHVARAQVSHSTRAASPGSNGSEGIIDGAKHPEMIPDEVAFREVFLVIAGPENQTDEEKAARAHDMIRWVGLNDDDGPALIDAVAQYKKAADSLDSRAAGIHKRTFLPQPGSTEWTELLDLQRQKDQLIGDSVASLQLRLSFEGMQKLRAHVEAEKRGMKIIPDQLH